MESEGAIVADVWLSDDEFTGGQPARQAPQADGGDRIGFHAKRAGVPRELLAALVKQESGGNPNAVNSETGATGLGQLMPTTAKELGVTDRTDPEQSLRGAADYLAQGYKKYPDDPRKALMYYYGGPNEKKWGPRTQAYPDQVLRHIKSGQEQTGPKDVWLSDEDFTGQKPESIADKQDFSWSPMENLKQTASELFSRKSEEAPTKVRDDQYPEDSYGGQKVQDEDLSKPSFARPFAGGRRTNPGASGDVGSLPAAADMIAGMPGQAAQTGVYLGARALLAFQGTNNEHAARMADDIAHDMVPEAFTTPFRKIAQALGFGDKYDSSTVSKVMGVVGKGIDDGGQGISQATGGLIQPQDVSAVANMGMLYLGAKGLEKPWNDRFGPKPPEEPPAVFGTGRRVPPAPEDIPAVIRRRVQDGQSVADATVDAFQFGTQGEQAKPHIRLKSTPEQLSQVIDEETGQPKSMQAVQQFVRDHPEETALGAAAVAAGGWMYMSPEDAEKIGIGGLVMAGAVKGKGGMWHPEAMEKLSNPLMRSMVPATVDRGIIGLQQEGNLRPDYERYIPVVQWSDKSVKNYLNKHAGTEGDPLRNVEFPMLGDGVTFGDAMDSLISSKKEIGPRGPEDVWQYGADAKLSNRTEPMDRNQVILDHERTWDKQEAIQGVLSHVGDYLREFVPPGRLQQYDLVRAVRETAEQDARQAKAMESARGYHSDKLPLYKAYDDGMTWRDVGAVKELTPEMTKTIKPTLDGLFQAMYPDGQPIYRIDPFTKEKTRVLENTPLEAYNAGHLANEGNVLGHCVGGYCEAVHNGESKIYSLRDKQGMSHVTVEVAPPDPRIHTPGDFYDKVASDEYRARHPIPADAGTVYGDRGWAKDIIASPEHQQWIKSQPADIIQIKGKQNRAPVDKYLPYVQDFVRSGKWGDVGDLQNTGLHDVSRLSAGEQSVAKRLYPGEKYLTSEQRADLESPVKQAMKEGATDLEARVNEIIEQRRQQGNVDPKLLARLAAAGLGAAAGVYLDPENPISAGLKGGLGALVLSGIGPKTALKSIKSALNPVGMVKIDQLRNSTEYARKAAARALWQVQTKVENLAPKEAQQIILSRYLRGMAAKLTPDEMKAAQVARQFFDDMWKYAKDAGVIETFEANYVTQLWGRGGKDVLEKIKEFGGTGSGSGTKTPYALNRTLSFDQGLKMGLKPLTEDLSTIMGLYGNSVIKAVENTKFINVLKNTKDKATGAKLLMKDGAGVPRDYETIDHPQLRGMRIHPDIAPDMKFIFDANDPNVIFRGLEALNTTQKRMAVSMSLFHAKALEDAMLGSSKLLASPGRLIKSIGQSLAPRVFGEDLLVKQIRTGGAGDLVDKAMKAGLEFSFQRRAPVIEEVQAGFYDTMGAAQRVLDNSIPGLGKATVGTFLKLNHAFDNFMWGRLHAGLKLGIFSEKLGELTKNNAAAHAKDPAGTPLKTEQELATMAASFTNDIFGGLNWQRLSMEPTSRAGREVASALYGPTGRRFMRLALFAPDWTISTTRAFVKAFTPTGSGVSGLWSPKNMTDLHRQYVIRSAFWYMVIGDTVNTALTGHHVWDNKDPTRLELGDGRTMQWSKHSMEPIHWLTMPGQQALNKLGMIPKELLTQALHKEYLSTKYMPEMQGSRVGHVLKNYRPIAVGQANEGDSIVPGIAGFFGAPIYGQTNEQKEKRKQQRREESRRKREEGRASQ